MKDKTLTDTEIKKALECISGKAKNLDCDKCAFDGAICTSFVAEKALNLINRQKAENERLKELLEEWKAEAYKVADEKDELYCNAIDRVRTALCDKR